MKKKPQISILLFLISLANVLGVLYSAALPDLTSYFQVTKNQAQETVSFYLIGCLLAQFIYAAIANALGRKSAIYIGGSLAILGSLLCIISIETRSFSLLLLGRSLTAFGAACGLVLTNTLLGDAYTIAETKKHLSYLMSGFAVFPAMGITIGGFITKYIFWQGCFYFMFIYSVFVIGLCIFLPETVKAKDFGHLKLTKIASSYFKQFSNLTSVLYALIVACASMILYVFSAEAPFIAKSQLHISADHFGLYNLIPNIGLFLGGFASVHLSHRYSSKPLILVSGGCFFLFSILMWIFFEVNLINSFTLFGMPLFIFLVTPLILSNGQACSLAVSEHKSYASSLMYIIQYSWVFLSIIFLGLFSPGNALALPIVYSLSGFLIIILWMLVRNRSIEKRS